MLYNHPDYRTYLKSSFSKKDGARDGYSLRAFSERLSVSNSYLSEILNGKKALSLEMASKFAIKLNLTDTETRYFCLLVQIDQEKDPYFREEFSKRLNELNPNRPGHDLSADMVHVIADWYHSAILELTYLQGFTFNAENISKSLNISKVEAEVAIDRLLRLELLTKDNKGRITKSHDYVFSEAPIPNTAFKKLHGQILAKAHEALRNQTPQERISSSDILAIDSKYLKKIDQLSREFSSAVLKYADRSKVKDNVYALSVHLFRLTNSGAKK